MIVGKGHPLQEALHSAVALKALSLSAVSLRDVLDEVLDAPLSFDYSSTSKTSLTLCSMPISAEYSPSRLKSFSLDAAYFLMT